MSSENNANWQRRPPYVKQDDYKFGEVKWHAQCDCESVRYEINQPAPLSSKFCHCQGCQKRHSEVAHGPCNCLYSKLEEFFLTLSC